MDESDWEEARNHAHRRARAERARFVALRSKAAPRELAAALERPGPLSAYEIAAALRQVDDAEKFTAEQRKPSGDRELLSRLRESGFAGREYEIFREELARYALPVLRAWMYSGYIFVLTAQRGHGLAPSDTELDQLRCDSDVRDQLANMIVATALHSFRDRVLVAGTWIENGGASLTTYFTGCCLLEFPNEFRGHRRTRKRWREQDLSESRMTLTTDVRAEDPADIVASTLWAGDRLAQLTPRARAIVVLRMTGYSYLEVAELLGETSVRAVEGVLHRLRTAERGRSNRKDER